MPTSFITSTAYGFTRLGLLPALCAVITSLSSLRAQPSAIWLRAEFATHKSNNLFGVVMIIVVLR